MTNCIVITENTFTKEEQAVANFLVESNAIENIFDGHSLYYALKAWEFIIQEEYLTASAILKTHKILMKGKLDYNEIGAWRKEPVWIGGHEAKPWYAVPDLIEQWILNANSHLSGDINEIVFQDDHVDFEAIHPFIDGNGRMGRILLNWQRVKSGLPILVIKEAEKWEYYKWFKKF